MTKPCAAKRHILVVDDDESVRESLKRVLRSAGYEALAVGSGSEAAAEFQPGVTDLLILDINLDGASGWDVFERITTRFPLVPVVVITGMPSQKDMALWAGVGALFEKPVDVEALLGRIQILLEESAETRLMRLCGRLRDCPHATPDKRG